MHQLYAATFTAVGGVQPYKWGISGKLPAGIALAPSTGEIAGVPAAAGTSSFVVTVTDSSAIAHTSSQNLTLTIAEPEAVLTISTTSLPSGGVHSTYNATLHASGGTLPYIWRQAAGNLPTGLTLSASGTLSGTATKAGPFEFQAGVNDSGEPAESTSKTYSILIVPGESALEITTASLTAGTETSAYSDTLEATGGAAPYTWSLAAGKLPTGLALTTAGKISGTATQTGAFPITVKVHDDSTTVQNVEKSLSLTVGVTSLSITTSTLAEGTKSEAYSQTLRAAGGTAPYSWSVATGKLPSGLTLAVDGVLSGNPKKTGTAAIPFEVRDSSTTVQTAAKTLPLTVVAAPPTITPVSITTPSLASSKQNTAYAQALAAAGGTAPYTWSMPAGKLPGGLSLNTTGMISGTPTTAGTFSFSIDVRDSSATAQTAEKAFTLTVAGAPAAATLSITTTTLASATENMVYSATLGAAGGTTPYTWSKTGGSLPAGVTLGSSGILSGAATASGTFVVQVTVNDTSNPVRSASQYLTLAVVAPTASLSITTASVANGKVNASYASQLAASGGTTPYAWSLASGSLPSGVTFSASGMISGTPKASGSYTIMSKVTDSESVPQTATKQFSFTVAATASTLAISTTTVPAGKVKTAYSTTLAATGGTTPYTWSLAAGSLPTGVSLSSSGTVSGTPTASGTFTFVAEVTDSGSPAQTAQMTYSLSVAATTTGTISISTGSLASGKVGTAYSGSLGATGGTAPYIWSLASGSLPTGLSLASGGTISGTPTAAGTSSFTLQVTDSSSPALTATQTFSLVIAANTTSLSITTTSVADGQVGASYSATVTATGGTTPYTWSLSSGSFPAGLSLGASTGTISGSPTASGTSSFTLKVTDSSSPSQTASQSYSIAISAAASGSSLTACGTLANAGTTYVLANDVSSAGSCFSIQASNITLNLNGHTITYNTASQSVPTYGISGVACWDASNPTGNPCGGTFDGFTVYGGAFVEGSGTSGTFAHCIRMGQGLNSGPTIHDNTFTFQTESAMGIYLDYAGASVPGGAIIYNNTFHNNDTTVVSRYNIDGASIRLDQGQATSTGAQIYNNTIIGGPQGGILDETLGGGAVYGNTISQGTVGSNQYTNDFAIYAWEQNINVHNNTITPSQGRGISIDSTSYPVNGTVAQSNTITVTESNDSSEYGGCPLGGTYGIQYDDNASGASDVSNTVVANALKCNAVGLRVTAVGTGDTSSNNSYSGKLLGGFASGVVASGLSLDSGGQPAFTATRDTFIGDTSSVYVDWDGAGPFTCISCSLGSGPTPTGYTTFYFWNGGTSVTPGGMHFRDTTFTGSASKTSTSMTVPGSNGQTAEYWIDWTYTVTVEDGTGAAVSGASVSITDDLGNNVFSGTTNSSGQASAVLTEFRMHNSGSSAAQEMHTPDAVSISKSGCTTLSYSTTVSGTTSETRSMTGTCSN
jgi:hypothetical protein